MSFFKGSVYDQSFLFQYNFNPFGWSSDTSRRILPPSYLPLSGNMYETLHSGKWGSVPVQRHSGKYYIIPFFLLSFLPLGYLDKTRQINLQARITSLDLCTTTQSMTNIKQKQNHKDQMERQETTGTVTQTQTISQSHRNAPMHYTLFQIREKRHRRWIRDYES